MLSIRPMPQTIQIEAPRTAGYYGMVRIRSETAWTRRSRYTEAATQWKSNLIIMQWNAARSSSVDIEQMLVVTRYYW